MSQNEWEVILEVLGEGGSIALYGRETPEGWVFGRELVDQTMMLLEDGEEIRRFDEAHTWEKALELISKYPWHMLYPGKLHPAFADMVYQAAMAKLDEEYGPDECEDRRQKWTSFCQISHKPG